jgi:DNA-binding transcriptional LysR family regulator
VELAQLHLVKQILETGSLSKTAMRLNRAQSVVSRQLAALERECGGRIFYRNGRGVLLTELGERVLPQIEVILAAAQDIGSSGAKLREDIVGDVTVSVSMLVAPKLIGPLFSLLKRTHPQIRLRILEAHSWDVEEELREGQTDIAVFMRSGGGVSSGGGRDDRNICEMETYLVGLPDSPATSGETIAFSKLAGLPLILPAPPRIVEIAAGKGMTLTIAAETNAPSTAAALVYEGAGYLITPLADGNARGMSWVGADTLSKRLRATRIVEPALPRKLVLSTGVNPKRRVDTVARLIEKLLNDSYRPHAANGSANEEIEQQAMAG